MKRTICIIAMLLVTLTTQALAKEINDTTITHTSEYYKQQVLVQEKYTKSNFMKAVAEGNTKLIEAYIKSGMDPNSTQMKLSAVIIAIGANKADSLQTLLQNGANVEIKTMGVTPLLFAINQKNIACIKILVDNKANVNSSYRGVTPLYTAVSKKDYEITKMLISAGAKVDNDTIIKAIKLNNEDIKAVIIKAAAKQL